VLQRPAASAASAPPLFSLALPALTHFFKRAPWPMSLRGRAFNPSNPIAPMIEVENLTKQFGRKTAVDHLSFSVRKGEVLGFLGPNGAVKSTTMRMVTGFLPPTSGDAKVCGISIVDRPAEAKRRIGYLPESAP